MLQKTKRSFLWIHQKKDQRHTGVHLIAEFWYGKIIEDPKKIKKILVETVKKTKNTPLKIVIHKFNPQGMTGIVLLAESHLAIHSWPEINYLAIDIFTCGKKAMPYQAFQYLKKVFQPKKTVIKEIKRGILPR